MRVPFVIVVVTDYEPNPRTKTITITKWFRWLGINQQT